MTPSEGERAGRLGEVSALQFQAKLARLPGDPQSKSGLSEESRTSQGWSCPGWLSHRRKQPGKAWRGYEDGDGCGVQQLELSGSSSLQSWLLVTLQT